MDLDATLINIVLSTGKLEPVIEANLTSADIEGEDAKKVFGFVLEYWKNPRYKGAVPTKETIQRQFQKLGWKVTKPKEEVQFVIDEVVRRSKYNYMTQRMEEISKALKKNDVDLAHNAFTRASLDLASRSTQMKLVSITKNTAERRQRYEMRRDGIGVYGIDSGIPWIDKYTMGWQNNDLVLILAKRGRGKTWLVMKFGLAAHATGKRVMVISKEMDPATLMDRFDALYAKLPYRALRHGQLGKQLEKVYYAKLKELEASIHDFFIPKIKGPVTPMLIRALAEENGIGLTVIDGVYMCQADNPHLEGWQKHVAIAGGLKEHVCPICPVIETNQLNKAEDQRDAGLDESAYSDAYGQFADVSIKMVQGVDERANGEMLLQFLKIREEEMPEDLHRIKWDLTNMEFDSISAIDGEEGSGEKSATAENVSY